MGQRLGGSEVEVGEDHLILSDERILRRNWLLHLHNHVRLSVHSFDGRTDFGPYLEAIPIGKSTPESRATLHDDGVLAAGQFEHASRRHAHPALGWFDFGGDSHGHGSKQIPKAQTTPSDLDKYPHNILTISHMYTRYTVLTWQ